MMMPFAGTWSMDCTLETKVIHPKSSSKTMQPNSSISLSPFLSLHVRFNFHCPSLNKSGFNLPTHAFSRAFPLQIAPTIPVYELQLLYKMPFSLQGPGVFSLFFQVISETQLFNTKFSLLKKKYIYIYSQKLLFFFFFFPLSRKITELTLTLHGLVNSYIIAYFPS